LLLYIIRHGDPIYSPDTLTEKGFKQAEALADRLSINGLDRVYSSPNGRARMTARPTCERLGLACGIEPWMSEDLAWKDFSAEFEPGRWRWAIYVQNDRLKRDPDLRPGDPPHAAAYLKGTKAEEGFARIKAHSDEFLERLGYVREGDVYRAIRPNDERVAAFCHHGFGSSWLAYLLAVPPHIMWSSFNIGHSGLTLLQFPNNEDGWSAPMCLCLSDMSHLLLRKGLRYQYNNGIDL